MADYEGIAENLIGGRAADVERLVQEALDEGAPVREILHDGLIKGMAVVGAKFKSAEFYVPDVLIAARAMKLGMGLIRPRLIEENVEMIGKAAIGTVRGDLHDIGKNLVAMMLEGAGFEVLDLGIDVSPEAFLESVEEQGAQVVCLSALLTTTMASVRSTVEKIKESGANARTLVGGAPLTQEFADKIGADGYAPDAASAAEKAKELIADLA